MANTSRISVAAIGRALGLASLAIALVFCGGERAEETRVVLTPPQQFLIDKETEVVGIVRVLSVENRWVILEGHGDHIPVLVIDCEMEEPFHGSKSWPAGGRQRVTQFDYGDMVFDPIAPPAIEGRRHLLWAVKSESESEMPVLTPWTAHPAGLLVVRGSVRNEFVFFAGKSYGVTPIRQAVSTGSRIPLDQIVDPIRRIDIARERLSRGEIGDSAAFVRGLMLNVQKPEEQAKKVDASLLGDDSSDAIGMSRGSARPHGIWYESLWLLRDLGKNERYRADVVAALSPVAVSARRSVRLATALALAELGSDAGREALLEGYRTDSGEVSSDPPDTMTFPARYPHDGSSITACAHALASLGDLRGLTHPSPKVRLAAAEGCGNPADPRIRTAMLSTLRDLQPDVEKLAASGELTKTREPGDHTNRYPEEWIRAHGLLAKLGDEESLDRLVRAYLDDAGTYPSEEQPLVPRARFATWSSGPSLSQAILRSGTDAEVLARLKVRFGKSAQWNSEPFLQLRAALGDSTDERSPKASSEPRESELRARLAEKDPRARAEALAAAGFHGVDALYDVVLDAALQGTGIEREAAIYGLGFYKRDAPDSALRRLLADKDTSIRFRGLELATRKNPTRFARESMEVARAVLASGTGGEGREKEYLPRVLCRLARGPLPKELLAGLRDPSPSLQSVVIQALSLSGNPDAVDSLRKLEHGSDTGNARAAKAAIERIGPS